MIIFEGNYVLNTTLRTITVEKTHYTISNEGIHKLQSGVSYRKLMMEGEIKNK